MDLTEEQIERYSRHIILADVGPEGQEAIMNGLLQEVRRSVRVIEQAGHLMDAHLQQIKKLKKENLYL